MVLAALLLLAAPPFLTPHDSGWGHDDDPTDVT